MTFYKNHVLPHAMTQLTNSEDGATVTIGASNDTWENESLEEFVFGERNKVVPESTTQKFGDKGPYQGLKAAATAFTATIITGGPQLSELDTFLSIGRGRLTNPVYTFTVRKTHHWFGEPTFDLVSIGFTCTISDLYDFNYEDGALSKHAAVLQIGYGCGANNRSRGQIYRHRIQINTTYYNPFIR